MAINPTLPMALSMIAAEQMQAAEDTEAIVQQLLDYCTIHLNATIQ